ncbi:unnamed protein product [Dicrocoelium dendriticum]|nr:unnamed protein product [Dicrocoelium dendriticum]
MDLCAAHDACAELRHTHNISAHLIGSGYGILKDVGSDTSDTEYWTSVNDMLVERDEQKTGWRALSTSGSEEVIDLDVPFDISVADTDVMVAKAVSNKVTLIPATGGISFATRTVCELSSKPQSGSNMKVTQFVREVQSATTSIFDADVLGVTRCTKSIPDARTQLKCAFTCVREPNCRSIYFNTQSSECVLMLYVQGTLPLPDENENDWERWAEPQSGP